MSKIKLQGIKRLDAMKAALPPATAGKPARNNTKGTGTGLMIQVPTETLKALRTRAAENGTTVRALVLEALRKGGYPVPADELVDRRRA
jgi:hypothetical protein